MLAHLQCTVTVLKNTVCLRGNWVIGLLKIKQSWNDFLSRCFFQKLNERIQLYYYDTTGWLVFVHFLEEIKDTKKTFQNQVTFISSARQMTWHDRQASWLVLYCSIRFTKLIYHKVVSSNTSHLEAHAGIYGLLMKGIFDAYVLWPFGKKLIFELVMRVNTRDFTVDKFW